MDVHDCSSVSKSEPLRPGNIVTIEPGVYIPLTDSREMADSLIYVSCVGPKTVGHFFAVNTFNGVDTK